MWLVIIDDDSEIHPVLDNLEEYNFTKRVAQASLIDSVIAVLEDLSDDKGSVE